ncbi:MAG: DUF4296 domain-containing protein [Bacteroidetes bacterium]|nr:DUF4296 domain-containing protein [Bacteroidota bacterium]
MKYLFSVLMIMAILSACKEKPSELAPPKDILPKDKMIDVLSSIHLAEAEAHLGRIPRGVQDSIAYLNYTETLKKHDLSVEEFEKSMKWYSETPEVFRPMYDRVIEQIKEKEQPIFEAKKLLNQNKTSSTEDKIDLKVSSQVNEQQ